MCAVDGFHYAVWLARRHCKTVTLRTVHPCTVLSNDLDVVGLGNEYDDDIGVRLTLNLTEEWREDHPFMMEKA